MGNFDSTPSRNLQKPSALKQEKASPTQPQKPVRHNFDGNKKGIEQISPPRSGSKSMVHRKQSTHGAAHNKTNKQQKTPMLIELKKNQHWKPNMPPNSSENPQIRCRKPSKMTGGKSEWKPHRKTLTTKESCLLALRLDLKEEDYVHRLGHAETPIARVNRPTSNTPLAKPHSPSVTTATSHGDSLLDSNCTSSLFPEPTQILYDAKIAEKRYIVPNSVQTVKGNRKCEAVSTSTIPHSERSHPHSLSVASESSQGNSLLDSNCSSSLFPEPTQILHDAKIAEERYIVPNPVESLKVEENVRNIVRIKVPTSSNLTQYTTTNSTVQFSSRKVVNLHTNANPDTTMNHKRRSTAVTRKKASKGHKQQKSPSSSSSVSSESCSRPSSKTSSRSCSKLKIRANKNRHSNSKQKPKN